MDNVFVQSMGEFIGTFVLVLLGDGVVAGVSLSKSKSNGAGWLAISLGWGFAVTLGIYTSSFMGPAHLNPAITIAFAIIGKVSWSVVLPYVIAQMIGGFLGAVIVWIHYLPHWKATNDSSVILGTFATEPAIRNYFSNFISEMIGTFVLVFALLSLTKGNITAGLNPIIVGIIISSIGISLGGTTGYAINPARDLGPRLAHFVLPIANKGNSDWHYSWVPVFGPILGGIIGALFFIILP